MAEGRWVEVAGKGRRWQQPSGELMMTKPGYGPGEFFQTSASQLLGRLGRALGGGTPRYTPDQMRSMTAPGLSGMLGLSGERAPTDAELKAQGYGFGAHEYDPLERGLRPPSASIPSPTASSSPAAERAYQAEKSRVAQIAAQNPDLQRYEDARLKAVAPGATPEQVQSAEDLGMQIWAKANPTLAAKVKPGQSGYDAIQGTLAGNMARAGQGFTLPQQLSPTPQGFPTQTLALPTSQGFGSGFSIQENLAPGAQVPSPFASSAPSLENLTSTFGQPNVVDKAKFEELLKLIGK